MPFHKVSGRLETDIDTDISNLFMIYSATSVLEMPHTSEMPNRRLSPLLLLVLGLYNRSVNSKNVFGVSVIEVSRRSCMTLGLKQDVFWDLLNPASAEVIAI